MTLVKTLIAAGLAASSLAACSTLGGAALGGAAGAAIGNNTGDGDAERGAAIGAVVGAVAGTVADDNLGQAPQVAPDRTARLKAAATRRALVSGSSCSVSITMSADGIAASDCRKSGRCSRSTSSDTSFLNSARLSFDIRFSCSVAERTKRT